MSMPRRAGDGLTLVSLFAGCGGSSLGYEAAGYDVRLAVDWDPRAAATYRINFPGTPFWEGDVVGLADAEALRLAGMAPGGLDVLDGSPPCQGFSIAGKRQFVDRRNRLFEEYVRLLRAFTPRAFVMENVGGLARGVMRLVFAEMTVALKAAGYRVSCRLLNAWWYGVPQDRRRLIWVGVREDLGVVPSHPSPIRAVPVSVVEALGEGAPVVRAERHQPQVLEAWAAARPGQSLRKVRPFIGSFQSVRLIPGRPSPTQIAVHRNWRWDEPRLLTVAEAKVLQGFPDWFAINDYYLVGNSVPPPMAEAVGRHVAALLKGVRG